MTIHVETIDGKRYLCSQSHEDRTAPNPVCEVTDVDPRCVTSAILTLNYGTQARHTGKPLGQVAYELFCSITGVKADWAAQNDEAYESWAQEFLQMAMVGKGVVGTYDSKTINGTVRAINVFQIEAYFPGSQ